MRRDRSPQRSGCARGGNEIHLYAQGNPEIERHLIFRDYLRAHPDARDAYAELKRALAEKFRNDRPAYTEAKTEFVRDMQARAYAGRENRRW